MECSHLTAAAREPELLVSDDRDCAQLLRCLDHHVGAKAMLAHCFLPSHLHLMVAGAADPARAAVRRALLRYGQWVNRRRGRSGGLLRSPVAAIASHSPRELARQIDYVHNNPVKTGAPIVENALHFEWSSSRAFAGLSIARFTNVLRARTLLGREVWRIGRARPALADLTPSAYPEFGIDLLLAAAAQVCEVAPPEFAEAGRGPEVLIARAVYVALGRLEGFVDGHLAAPIGRSRRRVSQMGSGPVNLDAVRMARPLLRTPALRARLKPFHVAPPAPRAARTATAHPT